MSVSGVGEGSPVCTRLLHFLSSTKFGVAVSQESDFRKVNLLCGFTLHFQLLNEAQTGQCDYLHLYPLIV